MGPPAPALVLWDSFSFFLGPVTQHRPCRGRVGGRKAAVSSHMALNSGKGERPVEAKPLS